MADEFDLKPTSRGEEFLDVILRSLGGDTPDIPQPAWRYEEYLAAIAKAIQNGGGGGGGGSAAWALVVEVSGYQKLNKTAGEIWAAVEQGPVVLRDGYEYSPMVYAYHAGSYEFKFWNDSLDIYTYYADSADDYPEQV